MTLKMLDSFKEAGSSTDPIPSFQLEVLLLTKAMKKALSRIAHMSKEDANAHIEQEGLSYTEVCEKLEEEYLGLVHNNQWYPAMNAKDVKTPAAKTLPVAVGSWQRPR